MLNIKTLPNNIFLIPLTLTVVVFSMYITHIHDSFVNNGPIFYDMPVTVSESTDKQAVKTEVQPQIPPKATVPPVLIPPRVTYRILPVYPMSALNNEVQGTVILSVYVGASGLPEKVETKNPSGCEELDNSAVKSISLWRFEPARRGIQPIGSWFQIPVIFKIK